QVGVKHADDPDPACARLTPGLRLVPGRSNESAFRVPACPRPARAPVQEGEERENARSVYRLATYDDLAVTEARGNRVASPGPGSKDKSARRGSDCGSTSGRRPAPEGS